MDLDYRKMGAEALAGFVAARAAVLKALGQELTELIFLRVSQLNGCSSCIDLHWRELVKAGVDPRKLNMVMAWRECTSFTATERAALSWAETMTRISERHPPDDGLGELRRAVGAQMATDITFAVAVMNAFNRLGVGFGQHPTMERA